MDGWMDGWMDWWIGRCIYEYNIYAFVDMHS